MREYSVYILASPFWTLYVGVTNDMERRMHEAAQRLKGFACTA